MDTLLNSVMDALAAVFRAIGVVGSARRRIAIRANLELLGELKKFPQFGEGSFAYETLSEHIAVEVARLAGVDLKRTRRRINWGTVIFLTTIWAPLGFLTYWLDRNGFRWISLLPGFFAGSMAFGTLAMFLPEPETPPAADTGATDHPSPEQPSP
jgi:hypothetical protein